MKKPAMILFVILSIVLTTEISSAEINFEAIKQIESSGFADALNPRTQARGLYGITSICLKDFNRLTKNHFKHSDLDIIWINRAIAEWYFKRRIPQLLKARRKPATLRNLLISYNAGHTWVSKNKLPKETRNYITKYERLAHEKVS